MTAGLQSVSRIFVLSPANLAGTRGQRILAPQASFVLARQLRSDSGVALGELFSFVSGLYFRGKLSYAQRFASPPDVSHTLAGGVHIITSNAGLRPPETRVTVDAVRRFASGNIEAGNAEYRRPLEQSARMLAQEIGECDVVLLGSIASSKYVDVLLDIFKERLQFPVDFVGRGDMSRGGLLLRSVTEGTELEYVPVSGAVRRGTRPPRLAPLCRTPR
jgi:hypothetical protein